jgi:hypothetical protein
MKIARSRVNMELIDKLTIQLWGMYSLQMASSKKFACLTTHSSLAQPQWTNEYNAEEAFQTVRTPFSCSYMGILPINLL